MTHRHRISLGPRRLRIPSASPVAPPWSSCQLNCCSLHGSSDAAAPRSRRWDEAFRSFEAALAVANLATASAPELHLKAATAANQR